MNPLFQNYQFKVKPNLNDRYELQSLIAQNINRPIKQLMKLTEIWTEEMLEDAYYESEKGEKFFWFYRKQTMVK